MCWLAPAGCAHSIGLKVPLGEFINALAVRILYQLENVIEGQNVTNDLILVALAAKDNRLILIGVRPLMPWNMRDYHGEAAGSAARLKSHVLVW